jgi:phosphoribosylformylglycinamidine synthase
VTVAPENEKEFEKLMEEFEIQKIGKVTEKDFVVKHKNEIIINTSLERMEEVYKKRFKDF